MQAEIAEAALERVEDMKEETVQRDKDTAERQLD